MIKLLFINNNSISASAFARGGDQTAPRLDLPRRGGGGDHSFFQKERSRRRRDQPAERADLPPEGGVITPLLKEEGEISASQREAGTYPASAEWISPRRGGDHSFFQKERSPRRGGSALRADLKDLDSSYNILTKAGSPLGYKQSEELKLFRSVKMTGEDNPMFGKIGELNPVRTARPGRSFF